MLALHQLLRLKMMFMLHGGRKKLGNDEVMYRMSSDAGKTFTDRINLSNTPNSD